MANHLSRWINDCIFCIVRGFFRYICQVDGGVTRASETGVYGLESEWLIEGWGFVPDIVVDNLPHETFAGRDAQLEAAVSHLQGLIANDPRLAPEPPPYPVLIPGSGFPTPWHKR